MDKLYQLAQGYNKRFPDGAKPYQIMTRLAEECGEVASEVNHFEGSGVKLAKYGPPDKAKLASEIKQVLAVATQLVLYYGVQDELEQSIEESLARIEDK